VISYGSVRVAYKTSFPSFSFSENQRSNTPAVMSGKRNQGDTIDLMVMRSCSGKVEEVRPWVDPTYTTGTHCNSRPNMLLTIVSLSFFFAA
jgi:hypothetical protein